MNSPSSSNSILTHRQVWRLALPVMLANVTEPLVGIADRAVAGRLGSVAHAAGLEVAATAFIFYAWLFGFLRLSTGGLSAQAYGAGDVVQGQAVAQRALVIALVAASLIFALQNPLFALAQSFFAVKDTVQAELSETFYRIRMLAIWGSLINFVVIGWLVGVRAVGKLMWVHLLINLTNIGLNILLGLRLGWGMAGIAWASVIATYLGTAVGLFYLWRLGALGKVPSARLWRLDRFRRLISVNADLMLRTLFLEAAFLLILRTGARFGPELLAVNGYILRFHEFMAFALDGFAIAVESLAGAAMGAASLLAFRRAVRLTTLWALGVALVWTLGYALFSGAILDLLTTQEPLRALGRSYLIWAVIGPLVGIWAFQLDGIFLGTTQTASMRWAMMLAFGVFLVSMWVLVPRYGNQGLWMAYTIFMLARAGTLLLFYRGVEAAVMRGTKEAA